jgi:hypothetical protein
MTSSPTFVARFVDGEVVRMTIYHDDERKTPDLKRGVRLARWAYLSRKKQEPLMIESASFRSCNGETLATYTTEQLAKALGPKTRDEKHRIPGSARASVAKHLRKLRLKAPEKQKEDGDERPRRDRR